MKTELNDCWLTRIAALVASLLLAGCGTIRDIPREDDPAFAPIWPEEAPTQVMNTGSMYQDGFSTNIFADTKAHRIGDIITVNLEESTTAQKRAKTELDKDSGVGLGVPNLLGRPVSLLGNQLSASVDSSNSFTGESKANQSNQLFGNITVNVVKVLPNGNLVVRGEKWININSGNEYIRLTGQVRPQDIGMDNTVASTRIANARIRYSGTGQFADTQTQGWLAAFFNNPLFPF